jgi:zinc/manganese transport system substrate-binding protein
MNKIKLTLGVLILAVFPKAQARIKVVTTTTDIAALVRLVGGDDLSVTSITKGSQDPHFVEAKPSYMILLRDADLLISNGLSLEIGWLPSLIKGSRNNKIWTGQKAHLDLGQFVDAIDKTGEAVTRAMGDVHPEGNPHFLLDPMIRSDLAFKIADRLAELDSTNKKNYVSRAKKYQEDTAKKIEIWQARVKKTGVKKVITYHSSLNYFLKRFNLTSPLYLEAKPGIPPTTQHILKVIKTIKSDHIKHLLIDNYFDTQIANKISQETPGTKIVSVGIAVLSEPHLIQLDDVTENLIQKLEAL